jgi:hypothetical protein
MIHDLQLKFSMKALKFLGYGDHKVLIETSHYSG